MYVNVCGQSNDISDMSCELCPGGGTMLVMCVCGSKCKCAPARCMQVAASGLECHVLARCAVCSLL